MSNQAKQINEGIEGLGDKIALPRTGFRSSPIRTDRGQLRRVGEEPITLSRTEDSRPVTQEPTAPPAQKAPSPYDRITFEITPEQRGNLTNIANTLNFRVPREKRAQKINRDMVMRALLKLADEIDWDLAEGIVTEDDLRLFVSEQLALVKKSADKREGN